MIAIAPCCNPKTVFQLQTNMIFFGERRSYDERYTVNRNLSLRSRVFFQRPTLKGFYTVVTKKLNKTVGEAGGDGGNGYLSMAVVKTGHYSGTDFSSKG